MSRASQRRAANIANRAITLVALRFGGSLPVADSHYVPVTAPSHPSDALLKRSTCGQYVNPAERHSPSPTCPNCRADMGKQVAS